MCDFIFRSIFRQEAGRVKTVSKRPAGAMSFKKRPAAADAADGSSSDGDNQGPAGKVPAPGTSSLRFFVHVTNVIKPFNYHRDPECVWYII